MFMTEMGMREKHFRRWLNSVYIRTYHSGLTYPNTEVMEKLATDELVRVVVLVRWKQFT